MNVREFMNDNPLYTYIGVGVVFVLAMTLVVCRLMGGGGASSYKLVYYDTEAKTIRIVEFEAGEAPKSPLEGEPNVYQAAIFSCGECDPDEIQDGMSRDELEAAGMRIRYIMKIDESVDDTMSMMEGDNYSYSAIDQINWVTDSMQEPMLNLVQGEIDGCPDARPCNPKP